MVAFTGAGISLSAGIPGYDMCWRGIPLRQIMTRKFANRYKEIYKDFYQEIMGWLDKEPTRAHYALAKAGVPVVTENIDMLHQKAGSKKVIELHGNLKEGIVLLGDSVRNWERAEALVTSATHLLVVGCSLDVKPAGNLPRIAQEAGAVVSIINEDADERVPKWLADTLNLEKHVSEVN